MMALADAPRRLHKPAVDVFPSIKAQVLGLYVHVPFCFSKCSYCAFYSEPSNGDRVNLYVEALLRELDLTAPFLQPETIFFGGGTPSLLNTTQWRRILGTMKRLDLLGASEWTVECNPATVSLDKARLLREHGVNRVSMGVQSLHPELLDQLGRVHTRDMVFRSFDCLRKAGFENINLDLMFAIPGQTLEVWKSTLSEAISMGSEHLSCYEVIYEEDTPLYEELKAGRFAVDEDLTCGMYEELISAAEASGFRQYEVANFAQGRTDAESIPAQACRHNISYWRGGEYAGLGPSACGYVGGVRTRNISSTNNYCNALAEGVRPVAQSERLSPIASAGEIAAFGLRMNAGWPLDLFRKTTGFELSEEWNDEIGRTISCGWGQLRNNRFRLTQKGLRFADTVAEWFIRA